MQITVSESLFPGVFMGTMKQKEVLKVGVVWWQHCEGVLFYFCAMLGWKMLG